MIPKIKSIADQIADHIHRSIFEGKILAGERLKENDVAKQLNVSRTPTREAFRILAAQGLVEITSNRGVRVTLITQADLVDLFEMRLLLELYCLRKFVNKATKAEIRDLEVLLQKMANAVADNDSSAYFKYSVDFHAYYINKCQNKRLISVFEVLRNNIRCAQILYMRKAKTRKKSVAEHRAIWSAIKAGDTENSETALRKHLENSYERMIKLIDRNEVNAERIISSSA
jgi:DNA-binding GntR family transcriptional regulator